MSSSATRLITIASPSIAIRNDATVAKATESVIAFATKYSTSTVAVPIRAVVMRHPNDDSGPKTRHAGADERFAQRRMHHEASGRQ